MEELKLLIEMVADLPQMALWVLVGFFVYKVVIVGSIFGVLRLLIVKLHSWLTTPKEELVTKNVTSQLERITISGAFEPLLTQLERLIGIRTRIDTSYIHERDVQWLREAITEKMEREKQEEPTND